MRLAIASGKGGTGKTSIAASLAVLAIADCNVDAADLHLLLAPQVRRREVFRSGHEAVIRQSDCTRCGICATVCRFDAVQQHPSPQATPRGGNPVRQDYNSRQRYCSAKTREILRQA